MSRIFNKKAKKEIKSMSDNVAANIAANHNLTSNNQYYQDENAYYQDDNVYYQDGNQYYQYDDQGRENQDMHQNLDHGYTNQFGQAVYDNSQYSNNNESLQSIKEDLNHEEISNDNTSYESSLGGLKPRFLNGKVYLENKEEMLTNPNEEKDIFQDITFKKTSSKFVDLTEEDNSKTLFRIKDLGVSNIKSNKQYANMELHNINLDIHSGDRIVILSDQRNYETLFVDLLKNNIKNTKGSILVLKKKNAIWLDAYDGKSLINRDFDLNTLGDINYNLISSFKNSLATILTKVISYFNIEITSKTLAKISDSFFLTSKMGASYNDLTIYEKYRFIFLCDIVMNKRVICINYMSIDLTIKEKICLFRFLNDYLVGKDIALILISNDITELKFLCNKIVIISNNTIKEEKYFKDILKNYESIDDYLALNLSE